MQPAGSYAQSFAQPPAPVQPERPEPKLSATSIVDRWRRYERTVSPRLRVNVNGPSTATTASSNSPNREGRGASQTGRRMRGTLANHPGFFSGGAGAALVPSSEICGGSGILRN